LSYARERHRSQDLGTQCILAGRGGVPHIPFARTVDPARPRERAALGASR